MKSEISAIVEQIKSGATTARAEVEAAIKRAEADDNNAILEIIRDRALTRADEIDAKIAKIVIASEAKQSSKVENSSGSPRCARDDIAKEIDEKIGRLAGVPFIAKDNFLTLGSKTTAASKILGDFEAPLQATAVERLEAAGAICIGKANLDAFAHGGSTENSAFGATKNAIDPTRVAGGSSGGSAVAVARGIVPFALGSDTGGSIRQPASFNGVIGYKPTYGMISRYGVVAMASSTDVVGPIARNVADVELLCDIMAGQDGRDSTIHPDYFTPFGQKKTKIVMIHGTAGSPDENWFPLVKREMEKLGAKVFVPRLPLGDKQNMTNWRRAFREQVPFELDENTILIGHSSGGAFMLSILQEQETPIKASIFVSAFFKDLGLSDIKKQIETFVDLDHDWALIRKNAGKIVHLHGDDDYAVPLAQAKELSKNLGSDLIIIEGGGSFE